MNRLAIVVALLVGLLVGSVATLATQGMGRISFILPIPTIPEPHARLRVMVARKDIPAGTRLHRPEDSFEFRSFAVDSVPSSALSDSAQLTGVVVKRDLRAKAIVTKEDLASDQEAVLNLLPPGYRAVTIPASSPGWGFLLPENRVDLVCIQSSSAGRVSKIFLENVLLLAVEDGDNIPHDNKPLPPAQMTFAVRAEDVERVIWTASHSAVTALLRRPDDAVIERREPQLALLPRGVRAVAISVPNVGADLIVPGIHVDLISTRTDPETQIRTSKILLQNVLVLAVCEQDETPEDKKSRRPRTKVFALSGEDTARLLAASSDSVISVCLRRPDDPSAIEPQGATGPFAE